MNVVVVGGYGYIGGHLVYELLKRQANIKILDSMISSKSWRFPTSDLLSMMQGSTINRDIVRRSLHKANVVYYLADRTETPSSPEQTKKVLLNNLTGLITTLTCCQEMGLDNFVYVSSAEIYGALLEASPSDGVLPVTLTGMSKHASESVLAHYARSMSIKILRPTEVWGGQFGYSYIDRFVRHDIEIQNDGSQTRDFLFIKDLIRALVSSMSWDDGIYNIGTGIEASIMGIWEKLYPNENPNFVDQKDDELYRQVVDISETVNWSPAVTIDELTGKNVKELCK